MLGPKAEQYWLLGASRLECEGKSHEHESSGKITPDRDQYPFPPYSGLVQAYLGIEQLFRSRIFSLADAPIAFTRTFARTCSYSTLRTRRRDLADLGDVRLRADMSAAVEGRAKVQ